MSQNGRIWQKCCITRWKSLTGIVERGKYNIEHHIFGVNGRHSFTGSLLAFFILMVLLDRAEVEAFLVIIAYFSSSRLSVSKPINNRVWKKCAKLCERFRKCSLRATWYISGKLTGQWRGVKIWCSGRNTSKYKYSWLYIPLNIG